MSLLGMGMDQRLLFELTHELLPVLAHTPPPQHQLPRPVTKSVEPVVTEYVATLRRGAQHNGPAVQSAKGAWAGSAQFVSMALTGMADSFGPLPKTFSQCLVSKKCNPFAANVHDIGADFIHFVSTGPVQVLEYAMNDRPAGESAFDGAYAAMGVFSTAMMLYLNVRGFASETASPSTPTPINFEGLTPAFAYANAGGVTAGAATMSGMPGGLFDGIVLMTASQDGGGRGLVSIKSVQDLLNALSNRKMSQGQLAEALGLAPSAISKWIERQKIPEKYLDAINDVLNGKTPKITLSTPMLTRVIESLLPREFKGTIVGIVEMPGVNGCFRILTTDGQLYEVVLGATIKKISGE